MTWNDVHMRHKKRERLQNTWFLYGDRVARRNTNTGSTVYGKIEVYYCSRLGDLQWLEQHRCWSNHFCVCSCLSLVFSVWTRENKMAHATHKPKMVRPAFIRLWETLQRRSLCKMLRLVISYTSDRWLNLVHGHFSLPPMVQCSIILTTEPTPPWFSHFSVIAHMNINTRRKIVPLDSCGRMTSAWNKIKVFSRKEFTISHMARCTKSYWYESTFDLVPPIWPQLSELNPKLHVSRMSFSRTIGHWPRTTNPQYGLFAFRYWDFRHSVNLELLTHSNNCD